MNESPLVGAYWGARQETRSECAVKILQLLESLAFLPQLENWYVKMRSRKASPGQIEKSVSSLEHLLRENRRELDGQAISELGFDFNAWNGDANDPVTLGVTCGGFSRSLKNSAVLNLPSQSSPSRDKNHTDFRKLLEIFVEVWDPDYAVVTSLESLAKSDGKLPWEVGGWMRYQNKRMLPEEG